MKLWKKTLYHIFSGADGILQCKCWKCRCERNSNYEKKVCYQLMQEESISQKIN